MSGPRLPADGVIHSQGLRLRPHVIIRLSLFVPAGILIAASAAAWADVSTSVIPRFAASVPIMAASFVLAMRWFLVAGAECANGTLIVRGLLWSRRIPRSQIEKITKGYVFVWWRTPRGHRRVSAMTAFWSRPNPVESVTKYNNDPINSIPERVTRGPGSVWQKASHSER